MSSVTNRRQIPIRPDANRAWLQNALLAAIGKTGTYQNAITADLRPMYRAVEDVVSSDRLPLELSDLEIEIEDAVDTGVDASIVEGYLGTLDRLVGRTLGLTSQGSPAPWVRHAVHRHVTHPSDTAPFVLFATFPFWREISINVHVDDFLARAEAVNHIGDVSERVEVEAPMWTAFSDWASFTKQAVAMFIGQLEQVRAEMFEDLDNADAIRRLGGLQHQGETVERIARLCMTPRRDRNASLLSDDRVENVKSEKEHIRTVCALITLDSPFSRRQKK